MPLLERILCKPRFQLGIIAVFLLGLCTFHLLAPKEIKYGDPGSLDFVQYWASYQVLQAHGNPYDPVQLLQAERAAGYLGDKPIMYWSPPWLIELGAPLLSGEFKHAAGNWLQLSVGFYVLAILLGLCAAQYGATAIGIIGTLLFAPLYDSLRLGQSSTLLAAVIALCLFLSQQRFPYRYYVIGLLVPLLSLKPHLFLLFSVLVIFRLNKQQIFQIFVGCFFTTTSLWWICRAHEFAFAAWMATLGARDASTLVDARYDWFTPTIASVMRSSLASSQVPPPLWPMYVVPLVAAILAMVTSQRLRTLEARLPPALLWTIGLLLSCLFAPYGWHYDLVIIVAPLAATLCDLRLRHSWPILACLLLGRIATPLVTGQHDFIYEPILLVLCLGFATINSAHSIDRETHQTLA